MTMMVTQDFELALIDTFERKNSQNPVRISKWGEFYDGEVALRNLFGVKDKEKRPGKKSSIGTQWSLPEKTPPPSPLKDDPNPMPDSWFFLQKKTEQDLQQDLMESLSKPVAFNSTPPPDTASWAVVTNREIDRNATFFETGSVESQSILTDEQRIHVAVSGPQNAQSLKRYKIGSIYNDAVDDSTGQNYATDRSYKQVQALYAHLSGIYMPYGVIVPKPPTSNWLSLIEDQVDEDHILPNNGQKCIALDRYFKRLAKHPILNRDMMLNDFLQDHNDGPPVRHQKSRGFFNIRENWRDLKVKWFGDRADYFTVKQDHLITMSMQTKQTLQTVQGLVKMKSDLKGKLSQANQVMNESSLIRQDPGVVEKIDQVFEAQSAMSSMCKEQEQAYLHLCLIFNDHLQWIHEAKQVLSLGQKMSLDFKNKKANATFEDETKLIKFTNTVDQELVHMEQCMKDDFDEALKCYQLTFDNIPQPKSPNSLADQMSPEPKSEAEIFEL